MKFLDKFKKILSLPDIVEKLNGRIEKLEKLQNETATWRITAPAYSATQSILYPSCPGGCEFPTHYVGDYIPCIKCGRTFATTTKITC